MPPTIIAKLGMQIGELDEVRRVLTALNDCARRAGVQPLPSPVDESV